MTHIGSGYAAEVDMALDILAELVETHTPKMAPFAIFVKVLSLPLYAFMKRILSTPGVNHSLLCFVCYVKCRYLLTKPSVDTVIVHYLPFFQKNRYLIVDDGWACYAISAVNAIFTAMDDRVQFFP